MANQKVVLKARVKTEKGWGHLPAAYAKNGRVNPGFVRVKKRSVEHSIAYYELRYYSGSKPVYEPFENARSIAGYWPLKDSLSR